MEPFAAAPVGRVETSTWLVDFWGAKLGESAKRALSTDGIAVLSPAVAALSRGTGEPLNPRHQSAWIEAQTGTDAVAAVVEALSPLGDYAVVAVSQADERVPLG